MSEVAQVEAPSETVAPSSGGLLGTITREAAPSPAPVVDVASQHQDSWFWDEGVPGNGPRPAWLKEKYTNIAAQAKAYVDAEKQLGQLGSTPEEYNFGDNEGWDPSNPHMQKFMETAKKSRMPQEAFNEMLNTLAEYEAAKMPNVDQEIAKLGPNARETIDTVKRWASTHLSQEACDVLGEIGNRAEVIKLMNEVRQLSIHQASQPPGASAPADGFVMITKEDIDAELAIPSNGKRYMEDPKYRAEISRKYALVLGEE